MDIRPTILTIAPKKLVGRKITMSWAKNRISELWKSFLPRRSEIKKAVSNELISMQIYRPDHFSNFRVTNEFEKWAAVEVSDFIDVPAGFEGFNLEGGLYAVFHYKGSSVDNSIYQYIFGTWLPKSQYMLDARPHFEVLGDKYKNNDANSEEDIWIPIKAK